MICENRHLNSVLSLVPFVNILCFVWVRDLAPKYSDQTHCLAVESVMAYTTFCDKPKGTVMLCLNRSTHCPGMCPLLDDTGFSSPQPWQIEANTRRVKNCSRVR
eukprot:2421679-Amphidinium_carterae.1